MSTNTVPGITQSTKQSPTANTKPNRLPAPTLFVGPPSRNASQLSISRQAADSNLKTGRSALDRGKSSRTRQYNPDDAADSPESAKNGRDIPTLGKPSEKSIDTKWKEMQSTLNEVEITAQSSTHVFGEAHAKALDDLRDAQVALAKAWGRGNEDKKMTSSVDDALGPNVSHFKGVEDIASERQQTSGRTRADTATSASTVLSDESGVSETDTRRSGKSQLEDETQQDIKLASERRAANEAYFKTVDQGVKEVVEKLEKVAEAMRSVEGESRSLWSGSDRSSEEQSKRGDNAAAAAG